MKMQSITVGVIMLAVFSLSIAGAAQESNATEELVDDIEEYEGSVGPGSVFYGLKLSVEKLDIVFTFNESKKLGKQVSYTRLRIAEAKAELKRKNNATANRALAEYWEDSEEIANSVAKLTDTEKGLLNAQKMIAKHQLVLRNLLNETPDNIGLQRAYDNSIELEKKFEEKTRIKLERRLTKQGRKVLEEVEIEEEREKIEVKAKILENATRVEVEIKFVTNKTENFTIADEILNKIEFINENINSLIKIEEEEEEEKEKLKEELEAEAEVKENISRVKFEYRFYLNTTNQSEIISGIKQKLSALEQNAILAVLKMEVKELETGEEREKIEVKAKILENATRVEVEVKFATNRTENFTIADEVLNKIKFINENINSLIKIEPEEEEEKEKLKEELEAEAEVKENISKVKFEYRFNLDTTKQSEIISGIRQKLSALEQNSILAVLKMEVKELEIEETAEKREERNKNKDEGGGRKPEED